MAPVQSSERFADRIWVAWGCWERARGRGIGYTYNWLWFEYVMCHVFYLALTRPHRLAREGPPGPHVQERLEISS